MSLDRTQESDALGKLLLSRRQIAPEELERARRDSALTGLRLATQLVAAGAIDVDALAAALGEVHGMDSVGRAELRRVPEETLAALPSRVAIRHLAIPLRSGPSGLEVAFVEPSDATIEAVAAAIGARVRARIAPEPLVYDALVKHYGLAPVPRSLAAALRAIDAAPTEAGPIPDAPDEYVTTPMGGVVPSSPDEVTTNPAAPELTPRTLLSPDDILLGAGDADPFGRTLGRVIRARSAADRATAILEYAETFSSAAALIERRDSIFRAIAGRGALLRNEALLGEGARSFLVTALATPEGYRGTASGASADALVLEALGREPSDLFVLRLGAAELLLWVDVEHGKLDEARIQELRMLAARSRSS